MSSSAASGFVDVSALIDLAEGASTVVAVKYLPCYGIELDHLEDLTIALARVGEVVYAIENRCSHDNGPLGRGTVEGREITCTRHGARFNLETGKATRMPAITPVMVFPARVTNGRVEIDLSDA